MESVYFQDMRLKINTITRRSDPARRPVLLEDKVQRSGFVSSLCFCREWLLIRLFSAESRNNRNHKNDHKSAGKTIVIQVQSAV